MVYFIQGEQTKLIKIGKAVHILQRLQALQCGSPDKLVVIKALLNESDDMTYHGRFDVDRVFGEWFSPSAALMAFIFSIPASEFDGLRWLPLRRRHPAREYQKKSMDYRSREKAAISQRASSHLKVMARCEKWCLSQGLPCSCGHHLAANR